MSHTAGPWRAVVYNGTRLVSIETVDHVSLGGIAGEGNARLAALAPEMLDALEMALEGLDQVDDPLVETIDALIEVRRVLKKAKGES